MANSRYQLPPNPVFLAPMEGVSHPEFRFKMSEQGGVDIVCTEFVRVSRAPLSVRMLRSQVQRSPHAALSVQVMGNDAGKMAEAAGIVSEAGAEIVDVNLGCPMPRVVRKGVGAAMLKDPVLLFQVLSEMRKRVDGLLSAKIRAGFDDATQVERIARVVQDAGVDFIVVHPRRRCDFYQGVSDWRIIGRLKEVLGIPVIGNGDIWYAKDASRMRNETGCDGVMLGRPALRNPWIFVQHQELQQGVDPVIPTSEMLFKYIEELCQRYQVVFAKKKRGPLGPLKELLRWMTRAIDDGGVFQKTVLRAQSVDEVLRVSEFSLQKVLSSQIDMHAQGHLALERSGSALQASNLGGL